MDAMPTPAPRDPTPPPPGLPGASSSAPSDTAAVPPPAPGARPPSGPTPPSGPPYAPGPPYGPAPPHVPGPPPPLARRLAAPLGTLAAVAAAFAYVGAVDPNEPGHYPVCPLLRFTGLNCPGCGGLRSAHAFIHGDIATAFGANALAVAGYFLFAVVMVLWLVRALRGLPVQVTLGGGWWWCSGVLVTAFTIVRNLPFGSALAP
ncbi:DUF2752 domain-containing protein [Streptomyces sp. NPDC006368]|uniref:DUF2752 domain-containing protein n=1 Tax=Streptomyces sp. NPDC006368 TaxID=3156760 RepID=UPI0033AFFA51